MQGGGGREGGDTYLVDAQQLALQVPQLRRLELGHAHLLGHALHHLLYAVGLEAAEGHAADKLV